MQQVSGGDGIAIVLLTDEERRRALTVICDEPIQQQLLLRLKAPKECATMLPEALLTLLPSTYELMVFGLYDGQYQVAMMGNDGETVRLRMSDAVLLTLMSDIPLYIEEGLMARQSVPFEEKATGIAIPINTMDVGRLKLVMQKAVDEENYELASQLRDEIKRRHSELPQKS
ncbi:MAG: UvrB/UvrC motif-containing protein [Prevotella sp.]|nr:UvrB/UvrC motif-containing protein [Prevotella sp.]